MVSPSGIWHQTSSSRVSFYWKDEQKNTHDNTLQYPVSWFEVSYIPIQSNLGIAVKSSQFKEGVIGMNILNLSVTYLTTSVTRWPDCFVKIWPFTTITICPKGDSQHCQIPNKPLKYCQTFLNICLSGEILQNLVTLVTTKMEQY